MNDAIERDVVLEQLVTIGYERVDQVEQRGHFAVRGDILDIYPVNSDHPIRIEFLEMRLTHCVSSPLRINALLSKSNPIR